MSTFKNKNSLRTIEAQTAQTLKNNEARPKFTGSYKKKSVYPPGGGLKVSCWLDYFFASSSIVNESTKCNISETTISPDHSMISLSLLSAHAIRREMWAKFLEVQQLTPSLKTKTLLSLLNKSYQSSKTNTQI